MGYRWNKRMMEKYNEYRIARAAEK